MREAGGDVEPLGDGAAELYLGRTVSSEGRGRATVGGRTAPAGVLAELADDLVVVHGQSDQLRLRSASAQRDALDRFGGDPVTAARAAYRIAWDTWRELDAELTTLTADRDGRAREAEELRAAITEIEAAAPIAGEEEDLARRAERLANAEELRIAAVSAHAVLSGDDDGPDVVVLLGEARRALERVASSDAELASIGEQIADLGYRATDIAVALSGYLADLDESGPHELAAVDERRGVLAALARAHGSVDAAIALLETGRPVYSSSTTTAIGSNGSACSGMRRPPNWMPPPRHSRPRGATPPRGSAPPSPTSCTPLALPDAKLTVEVAPSSTPGAHGRDDVAILLAPHPGADPRPVSRGASGGELSRVMLAIEVVIAGVDPRADVRLRRGGCRDRRRRGDRGRRRLARLAESSQVIAVTHLAQVAAFAGNHLTVVKGNDGAVTASSVRRLEGAEREAEMARLLSGLSDSDAALTHARELLETGRTAH